MRDRTPHRVKILREQIPSPVWDWLWARIFQDKPDDLRPFVYLYRNSPLFKELTEKLKCSTCDE
jgi:hypothetical protein